MLWYKITFQVQSLAVIRHAAGQVAVKQADGIQPLNADRFEPLAVNSASFTVMSAVL